MSTAIRELLSVDIRAVLADSYLVDPDAVDVEAVAGDIYRQYGTTNLEAIPHDAFWGAVNRHAIE